MVEYRGGFRVAHQLAVRQIGKIGGGMAEPCAGVGYGSFPEMPGAGAVEMPQDDIFCLWEVLFCKLVGLSSASQPATDDAQWALRWPEAVHETTNKRISDALSSHDWNGQLAHGACQLHALSQI